MIIDEISENNKVNDRSIFLGFFAFSHRKNIVAAHFLIR